METFREARDAEIARLRAGGLGLDEIGQKYGLTRERVRQIVLEVGGATSEDARRARQERAASHSLALATRIEDDIDQHGASTYTEVAERTNISIDDVRLLWPRHRKSMIVHQRRRVPQWTDDEIRSALQVAATFEYPLRRTGYDELLLTGEVKGPIGMRLVQRFGSWGKACAFAGIESGRPPRDNYQSRWTDSDLMDFVRQYLETPGYTGSFHRYDEWRRDAGLDAPSSATVRNRLGAWSDIKKRVYADG